MGPDTDLSGSISTSPSTDKGQIRGVEVLLLSPALIKLKMWKVLLQKKIGQVIWEGVFLLLPAQVKL